jgi:hypothetical protein
MNAELQKIVHRVEQKMVRSNPPGDDDLFVDGGTLLQLEILQSGLEFKEEDVLKAASAIGVPDGSLIDWLEEMASWV